MDYDYAPVHLAQLSSRTPGQVEKNSLNLRLKPIVLPDAFPASFSAYTTRSFLSGRRNSSSWHVATI